MPVSRARVRPIRPSHRNRAPKEKEELTSRSRANHATGTNAKVHITMDVEVIVKNYRCFSDSHPARFVVRDGFTAFVGVNNCGKSTLIKLFFEFRSIFEQLSNPTGFVNALRSVQSYNLPASVSDSAQFFCNDNDRDITIDLRLRDGGLDNAQHCKELQIKILRNPPATYRAFLSDEPNAIRFTFESGTWKLTAERTDAGPIVRNAKTLLETLGLIRRTLYIGAFRNAINIGTKEDYFDIEVGQSFIKKWKQYQAGTVVANNQLIHAVIQDITKLFGFERLEIQPTDDDQSLQLFVDGKPYKLSELGAGLAQFLIVLANVAIKKPALALVDEPELNLHPALQRAFLTAIASYAPHGVLFATHSLGLARSSAERIYSVRRREKHIREVREFEATRNFAEFLGELSFSGYMDLGSNKILLVEGTTDLLAIQELLRLYRKDHEIIIMPLGGSSMINEHTASALTEITRLSPEISALIDSERTSMGASLAPDREAFKTNCASAGINCHVLDRRAIENYFPDDVVKKVFGDKYRGLAPCEAITAPQPSWAKRDNWGIAKEMRIAQLAGNDLGSFLSGL
jgi:ABC-type cobalamin/Fe3+-siderophores transport system ATPase subunit